MATTYSKYHEKYYKTHTHLISENNKEKYQKKKLMLVDELKQNMGTLTEEQTTRIYKFFKYRYPNIYNAIPEEDLIERFIEKFPNKYKNLIAN